MKKTPSPAPCGCCRAHDEETSPLRMSIRLGLALALAIAAGVLPLPEWLRIGGFGAALLVAGYHVFLASWRNLRTGQVFDENFLMGIASLGAFAIGEMPEAVAVMIFYGVGEALQDAAVSRSKRNIEALMDLRSDHAAVKRDGKIQSVPPENVAVGEIVVVRPGEKIPLDGIVRSGAAFLDTRALTGESVPRRACPEDEVFSGTIDTDAVLEIEVIRPLSESTVSRILDLVRNAADKKSPTEKFITRFARWYTPAVVALAVLVTLVPPLAGFGSFSEWLYRALSLLIISCPCALVLSIPLSYFGGIGGAARQGILVKGGNYLDLLNRLGTIAFDKTGTLTQGVFKVTRILPEAGVAPEALLRDAAIAEQYSTHPIARAIREAHGPVPEGKTTVREAAGLGIEAEVDGAVLAVGNAEWMRQHGIEAVAAYPETTVHVARGGRYLGCLLIADELRPGVREALNELRAAGVERLVMLTGDSRAAAEKIAAEAGVTEYHAALLPDAKVTELEALLASEAPGQKTAFVGDGINDAPVLSRADLGIAMGGIGADAAIEAADVVILTDDIGKIATAIRIAVKTRRIVWQNILMALGFKFAVMVLALAGIASVWFAIFADVGVALLAVANALRALRS